MVLKQSFWDQNELFIEVSLWRAQIGLTFPGMSGTPRKNRLRPMEWIPSQLNWLRIERDKYSIEQAFSRVNYT